MVINDIFDIDIDKINNPMRPLVTGEIEKREAITFSILSLFLCEYLSMKYLPIGLQYVIHLSIIDIIAYTKMLKPMFLIKNISCASLISFALCFSGFASTTKYNEQNLELLRIGSRLVFFGSLHNEMLLDISDYEGDKQNNIPTLPVVYSIPVTWNIVYLFTKCNILFSWLSLLRTYNYWTSTMLLVTTSPLLFYLIKIKRHNYSKYYAKLAVKKSLISLFLTLLYLCGVARVTP
jgi:geranylgeranylglycerol-phosphate geranylgeranyltransferase